MNAQIGDELMYDLEMFGIAMALEQHAKQYEITIMSAYANRKRGIILFVREHDYLSDRMLHLYGVCPTLEDDNDVEIMFGGLTNSHNRCAVLADYPIVLLPVPDPNVAAHALGARRARPKGAVRPRNEDNGAKRTPERTGRKATPKNK